MMTLNKLSVLLCLLSVCSACQKGKPPVAKSRSTDYERAEQFLANQQTDSAFYYYNQVALGAKNSLEAAMAYNHMAAIQSDAGDYYGAQESLTASLKYLSEHNPSHRHCLASDYNELAMTSSKLKNYDQALAYYDLAIGFSDNPVYRLIFLNNKANVYQRKKAYGPAIQLYKSVLRRQAVNTKEYARTLTNLVHTQWLENPNYSAGPALRRALAIRIHLQDLWGQNSSFAHLADFYANQRPDSALLFARQMYVIARQLNSPDDQLEALQKLIKWSPTALVQHYFTRYEQITDSLTTVRNAAKNQFALIRYEAQKNKTDALFLQQDNTQKQYQITKQWFLLAGSLLLTLAVWFWYRKRKQSIEHETQAKIKANELRVSKKVHDVVANGLYRVMNEVEYGSEVNKDKLLDQLEDMYERSRDISYETPGKLSQSYTDKIAQLMNAFKSNSIRLAVNGNETNLWDQVPPAVKRELEHVLQELMVNMSKHSQANQALVSFSIESGKLQIVYQDNGVGLSEDFKYGNGLMNTDSRIQALNGRLIFDRQTEQGLHLNLIVPLK